MIISDYLIAFYCIVVGLTVSVFLKGWAFIIKDRNNNVNYLTTIIWSLGFFVAILNEWIVQFPTWESKKGILDLISTLIVPFGIYVIGILIFPTERNEEEKEDYLNHFVNQKSFILGISLFLIFLKMSPLDFDLSVHIHSRVEASIVFVPSLVALFTKNRNVLNVLGLWIFAFWVFRISYM